MGEHGASTPDDLFWAEDEVPPAPPEPPAQRERDTDDFVPASPQAADAPPWLRGYAISITIVALILLAGLVAVLASKSDKDEAPTGAGAVVDQDGEAGTPSTEAGKAEWPAELRNRPEQLGPRGTPPPAEAGAIAPGAYLWSDFNGWHLWFVRGEGVEGVKGTITVDADPTRAAAAAEGQGTVTQTGTEIAFDFSSATAPIVGVEFNLFYGSRVDIQIDTSTGPLDGTKTFLGSKVQTSSNPIVIVKS